MRRHVGFASISVLLLSLVAPGVRVSAQGLGLEGRDSNRTPLALDVVGGELVRPRVEVPVDEIRGSHPPVPRPPTDLPPEAPAGHGLADLWLPGAPEARMLDASIRPLVSSILEEARRRNLRLTFTSAFRSSRQQQGLWMNRASNPNPVAEPGTSRHEAGFAVDVSRTGLTEAEWAEVINLFERHGARWAGASDPVHFEWDPIAFGYPSRAAAILANQAVFDRRRQTR